MYYAYSSLFGTFVSEAEYAKEMGKYLFYVDSSKDGGHDE